jgi:hypothetical protein
LKVFERYSAVLILGCLVATVIGTRLYLREFKSPSSETYFVRPAPNIEYFTFGYRELMADMMWLRTIQDIDQCERSLAKEELCSNSWVYQMVNKITDLSPNFRIIYATVPILLAFVVTDVAGGVKLFDKGIKYFPNDWPILYRGGYLYLFNLEDKVKAAEFFVRAEKNGGPDWLASFATRLFTEAGREELAQHLISEYEKGGVPEGILRRMQDHLKAAAKK